MDVSCLRTQNPRGYLLQLLNVLLSWLLQLATIHNATRP